MCARAHVYVCEELPTLPRATRRSEDPKALGHHFPSFFFQVTEANEIFQKFLFFACWILTSAQKTLQAPGKTPIFEKSADQRVDPLILQKSVFWGVCGVFCARL